ncbi:MAG: endonuclease/exonuclease/phosphatase family protein [Bacteroidaceae bacterium]|nr:endonuclease/exonuclease/phosphatase family protein [Bacteroidaceae bacterium]
MIKLKSFALFLFVALLSGTSICAQNIIEGYKRVFYSDDLKDGKTYFLISDRTKYAGNNTGKPKGMSYKLDHYTISWDKPSEGIYFVYWGDFDADEEGFQWIAEKVGDDQWAFKNKVRGEYLGVKNSYDDDVLFSGTPVGYILSDLDDGLGRFFMTSSDDSHSPHVQGYLRSDRPNNSLAKQYVGDDDYPKDGATNGYPGRWQIYEVDSYTGNPYVTDISEIKEGEQYYIVSDRTKFAGNSTGLPKAMACLQDNFKINWGNQYVYWADLDKESDGFIWTAQKDGDQWAFLNKENGKYLGNMNMPAEADILFSDSPVGYTLTDLTDGAGRFFMTNSESEHSLHVQGYLRSDRPNNSLAKQNVGDDDYPGDAATAGYPGRWKFLKVNPGEEEPSEFFNVANGYYSILNANSSEKKCWSDLKADAAAYEYGASLILNTLHNGDPRNIYRIEAVDREKGQYRIRNYVTGKYVSGTTNEGYVFMTDEEQEPLTFITIEGNPRAFCIYNADGVMLDGRQLGSYSHICGSYLCDIVPWKVQKVDAASLESPAAQLKLALARKMDGVGHPDFGDSSNLSEEQRQTFRNVWDKANEDLANGTPDILYESDIKNLEAAAKGEYTEPVYDKYQKVPLRVLSYNVRHCAGNHDGLNLARTASVIAAQNADVVALQEVDSVFSSRSDYKYQIKELAEATGLYGIFCSALTGYGIGILCKEIPLSVRAVSLTADGEPRRMLMAEFDNYVFASLHVGLSANARRGTGPVIKAAAEEWVETGKPLIIAGDFNDDGTDDEMQGARGVLTKYLQENGFTYHSDLTTPTWSDGIYIIDNIISYDPIGGVEKVSYEVVNDKVTSDHMPIIGDFIIGFDNPNAINSLSPDSSPVSKETVYDLSGRKILNAQCSMVNGLKKGIYIVNGSKILK